MSAPKWYSAKDGTHVPVDEITYFHATNALAKLDRGDAFGPDGEPYGPVDTITLRNALQRRIGETQRMADDSE